MIFINLRFIYNWLKWQVYKNFHDVVQHNKTCNAIFCGNQLILHLQWQLHFGWVETLRWVWWRWDRKKVEAREWEESKRVRGCMKDRQQTQWEIDSKLCIKWTEKQHASGQHDRGWKRNSTKHTHTNNRQHNISTDFPFSAFIRGKLTMAYHRNGWYCIV